MSNRFLSIDDILAEEERVPCVFLTTARRLGHLDPTSGSGVRSLRRFHFRLRFPGSVAVFHTLLFFPQDIEEESRIELPLWMAETLADHQYVVVQLPRNFSAKVREAMLANPENVRLRERSPYFYEAGLRLSSLSHMEEAKSLPAAIQATLAIRVGDVLVKAQHSSERVEASKFLEPMTDLEQSIFWSGYHCLREYTAWRQRRRGELIQGKLSVLTVWNFAFARVSSAS
jgi:GINS complex subunit 3